MACECATGERTLRVHAERLDSDYPELFEFEPGFYWDADPDRRWIDVLLGGSSAWQGTADVVNFLRTVLDAPRLERLQAQWRPRCSSCTAEEPSYTLVDLAPPARSPLHAILMERRVETHFQPIFMGADLELWGYECLMRIRHDGADISPAEMLDWARRERMFCMLDRVCRETHITNAALRLPPDVRILINFLPTAIYDPRFCLRTTEALIRKHKLDPSRLIFEVVESERVVDREALISILAYYRQAGYGVAIDDVGAGYSGLMMLADLNPDVIKIDRGLVSRACDSKMHRVICNALVRLAHDCGRLALAEGVETEREFDLMRRIGADLFQGYLLGKPSPEPAERALIAA